MIAQTMYTPTGHGPFLAHLVKLRLTDEPSCSKCDALSDNNFGFGISIVSIHSVATITLPLVVQYTPVLEIDGNPSHLINFR